MSKIFLQYAELKSKYKDCLILFRKNLDKYIILGDDAIIASDVLNLQLSASDIEGIIINSTSFPYYKLNNYLPKLIRAGIRVAIADLIENNMNNESFTLDGVKYERVFKAEAQRLFDAHIPVYLIASNMNPHSPWSHLTKCDNIDDNSADFVRFCNSFAYYNCNNECGKYIKFFKIVK